MNKKKVISIISIILGLLFCGYDKAYAQYTNTGWDWQSIPSGAGGTSYGSINPNGGKYSSSVNSLAVRLKPGTTPKTNFVYTPENAEIDPWGKGNISVSWSGTVIADVNLWNAITQINKGLGFVAHINLPQSVFSGDVQNSIVNATQKPKIRIGNTDVQLSSTNFVPIGPHTLRLTMTKNNISNLSSQLISIVLGGADMNNLPINFSISVPITSITEHGAWNSSTDNGYYTGVQFYLTHYKFPPMQGKTDDFSVDFYGTDDIQEGGNSYGGGTGYFYAKLNADNTFIPKNRVYSQTPIKSWDKFITLWDNKKIYNNQKNIEVIDGSDDGLGTFQLDINNIKQNNLDLNIFYGTWNQINLTDPTRFDRVADFFTMKSVPGITLSHSSSDSPGIGNKATILYTGSDLQGTPLSPVKLIVSENYLASDIKVNNFTTFEEYTAGKAPTIISQNTNIPMSISWKAPSLKSGKIVYRVLDPSLNTVVKESTFSDNVLNTTATINNYQIATGELTGLPKGTYLIQFKVIDNDYPSQNNYMPTTKSALVTSADMPIFKSENTITNSRNDESSNDKINALWGDTITENIDFTVTYPGSTILKSPFIKFSIPNQTTFIKDSLIVKLNGNIISTSNIDTSNIGTGLSISLPETSFKASDKISLTYKYKLNNIANQTLSTSSAVLGGQTAFTTTDGKVGSAPILPFSSSEMHLILPDELLQLTKIPNNLSFGETVVPYKITDIPVNTTNLLLQVNNTRVGTQNSSWQINATLSKEFQNKKGQHLNSDGAHLVYKDGETKQSILNNQSTPIYSYNGEEKGIITKTLPGNLFLHLDPFKLQSVVETDSPYTCEVTWELSEGPTN